MFDLLKASDEIKFFPVNKKFSLTKCSVNNVFMDLSLFAQNITLPFIHLISNNRNIKIIIVPLIEKLKKNIL